MKASELRIGNYVNYCNEKCVLDAELFLQLLKYTTPFEPILLTEKQLIDFGFNKHENCRDSLMQMYYNNFRLKLNNYNEISLSIYNGDDNVSRCNYNKKDYKIRFVHQLQNLFFALTGEELIIKD